MEDLGKLLGNTLVGEWRSTADGERHRRGEERERERGWCEGVLEKTQGGTD